MAKQNNKKNDNKNNSNSEKYLKVKNNLMFVTKDMYPDDANKYTRKKDVAKTLNEHSKQTVTIRRDIRNGNATSPHVFELIYFDKEEDSIRDFAYNIAINPKFKEVKELARPDASPSEIIKAVKKLREFYKGKRRFEVPSRRLPPNYEVEEGEDPFVVKVVNTINTYSEWKRLTTNPDVRRKLEDMFPQCPYTPQV